MIDPRAPCLVGVARRTWHPNDAGEEGAPEPLAMWEEVARAAAADASARAADPLGALDSLRIVYCQTWQYDDPVARLAERLGAAPRQGVYTGIGGTTPQQQIDDVAGAMLRGELDVALVVGAEALATRRRAKQRGVRPSYSFPPPERRPFPWEAPFHPAEVAHEVFQAWLTFALWDNARRAHLGVDLPGYRDALGALLAPFTEVAAENPHAWFRVARTPAELVTPTAENRFVGYPYTKYMVSIMDVDMAAAVLLTTHEAADRLGVPAERRVYVRGWCYATDPVYVAEHPEPWRSPAMGAAAGEALRTAGAGVDDIAHLDLYSCFASSVLFACDALGIDPARDPRALTVTGGLPYHGGAGSNYLTHSIATMVERLRSDPGTLGLVSGVGMHMTKHVFGLYGSQPGPVTAPDEAGVQARLDATPPRPIVDEHAGPATVAAYSVVHGRDGAPEWGLLVCDVGAGARCYARVDDAALLASMEEREWVGETVTLTPVTRAGPAGEVRVNRASR